MVSGLDYVFCWLRKNIRYSLYTIGWLMGGLIFQSCTDPLENPAVPETGTVTDHEGHSYATVKIGQQWWMAENLQTTSFLSGQSIMEIQQKDEWANTDQPGYCTYNNVNSGTGILYNFYAIAGHNDLAPEGWHIPSDEDWKILESTIGLAVNTLDRTNWRGTKEGDLLKVRSTVNTGWIFYSPEVWGTNATGFSAIGGSCRVFNGEWGVPGLRHSGFWWSSTPHNGYGWYRYLDYKQSGIFRYTANPNYGFSIRCVKNN